MNKNLWIIALGLLALTSCGIKVKSDSKPDRTTDPLEEYHQRPLDVTQTEEVHFTRKEQMTTRYDCNGHVTSHKLETLNSLSKKITVNYSGRKSAWSYDVYNRRTKSSNRGAFMTGGHFVIDYSPTVFNMRVKEGENQVEYVFYKCPKIGTNPDGSKICLAEPVVEKEGLVKIDVTYGTEIIPGLREFRPAPEQCKPTLSFLQKRSI